MQNFTLNAGESLFIQIRVLKSRPFIAGRSDAPDLTRPSDEVIESDQQELLEGHVRPRFFEIEFDIPGGFYINGCQRLVLTAGAFVPVAPGMLFWINLSMTGQGKYVLKDSARLTFWHRHYSDAFVSSFLGRAPYSRRLTAQMRDLLLTGYGGKLLAYCKLRPGEISLSEPGKILLDVMNNADGKSEDILLEHEYIMGILSILPPDWESKPRTVKAMTLVKHFQSVYSDLNSFMTAFIDSPWKLLEKFDSDSHRRSITFQLIDAMCAMTGGDFLDPTRLDYGIGMAVLDVLNNGSWAYHGTDWGKKLGSNLSWAGGDCYASLDENGSRDWLIRFVPKIREFIGTAVPANLIYDRLLNAKSKFLAVDVDKNTGFRFIYPRNILKGEDCCARIFSEMLRRQSAFAVRPDAEDKYLESVIRKHFPFAPSGGQVRAFQNALTQRFSVITGGPGAGKTTLISVLVKILREWKPDSNIVICAATGKAVKQIRDDIAANSQLPFEAYEARTVAKLKVHSKLEVAMGEVFDGMGQEKFSPKTCMNWTFILDEASMASLSDFVAVTQLSRFARLIVVGDKDQLCPISPGQPFRDLFRLAEALKSTGRPDLLPVAWLEGNFRVAADPEFAVLVENFNYIREHKGIKLNDLKFVPGVFERIDGPINRDQAERIVEDYLANVAKFGIEQVAICTPVHRGSGGDAYLNFLIQGKVNPWTNIKNCTPQHTDRGDYYCDKGVDIQKLPKYVDMNPDAKQWENADRQKRWCRIGDRVVITENFVVDAGKPSQVEIANGDTGVIMGFHTGVRDSKSEDEGPAVDILLDTGSRVLLTAKYFDQISLAYAMTVHKIQGSGYDCIMVVYDDRLGYIELFNTKNMLYTALTRAKKYCCIYGKPGIFEYGLNNVLPDRKTRLVERTMEYLGLR